MTNLGYKQWKIISIDLQLWLIKFKFCVMFLASYLFKSFFTN